ncbi:MAG: hypothetical protein ABI054_11685 [Planctomycetota bacterium]
MNSSSLQGSRLLGGLMPCLLSAVLLSGCGEWPPIVDAAQDIADLPEQQDSIRTRGLPDSEIHLLARFQNLETLDFHGGWAVKDALVTDDGLRQLVLLELPRLDLLNLGRCRGITDQGLAHVARMQTIRWLGLSACSGITDAGLPSLLSARNLTGLDLRGCSGITDAGIQQLAAKTNWLEIWFGGCPNVTSAGVARLQAALPAARVEKDDAEWEYVQR